MYPKTDSVQLEALEIAWLLGLSLDLVLCSEAGLSSSLVLYYISSQSAKQELLSRTVFITLPQSRYSLEKPASVVGLGHKLS